ncbi:dioxygenase family protein [Rathayibacter sp. VKM Ac-2630]|uniref:dioxygenase family protein n=1 Tax=Rathayibacter sp. VKM Ac-2630 TaxID=1938617 RepID=UPI0026A527B1
MTRIPEPDLTPQGPAYQGRRLDRPHEEVVDQGLPFDVATLVSRRRVLSLIGVGAATMGLAACTTDAGGSTGSSSASGSSGAASSGTASTGTTAIGEIPDETAGPYPGDGSNGVDVLENAGVVRSDIRSSIDGGATAAGVPMTLTLTILDTANGDVPFEGAAVYVWHCDADGNYSMYSSGVEDETYLRGVQVADASGSVTFASVFPACYSGRWPHIHFEVYPDAASITDAANASRPRRSPSPRTPAPPSTRSTSTADRRRTSRRSHSRTTTSSATTAACCSWARRPGTSRRATPWR